MFIKEIINNKTDCIDILLIGDENIEMVNKYLNNSRLFGIYNNKKIVSICAVLQLDFDTVEIKNLATYPKYQNKGYASKLIEFVCKYYKNSCKTVILGTGESEKTLNFYKKRGFKEFKRIENFFIKNYPKPIFENGKQLIDMICLKKNLNY